MNERLYCSLCGDRFKGGEYSVLIHFVEADRPCRKQQLTCLCQDCFGVLQARLEIAIKATRHLVNTKP